MTKKNTRLTISKKKLQKALKEVDDIEKRKVKAKRYKNFKEVLEELK